jgi:hypothetical protein
MATNNRFDVKKVSEVSDVPGDSKLNEVPLLSLTDLGQSHGTYPAVNTDQKNHRGSLAQLTREALPRLDHYRNSTQATKRPSLGELHGDPCEGKVRPYFNTYQ